MVWNSSIVPPWACWRLLCWRSELQQQRELDLASRAEVSRGETGAADDPKRLAGCGEDGVAKIGMVEDIEQFGAELQIEAFGDLRILGDREIGVDESRTGDGVAAKAAWMARARHDWISVASGLSGRAVEQAGYGQRCVHGWPASWDRGRAARRNSVERFAQHGIPEVIRRIPGCSNCRENVGPHGERNSWARSDGERGIQRIASLRLEHQARLPAGDQAIPCERKLIKAAEREAMASVELRKM